MCHVLCDAEQGVCVLSKCECFDGFWGESCDQLKCPGDVCVYDYKNRRQVCHQCCGGRSPCVENRGLCNGVTASCECKLGFTGENCNVLKCPTDPAVPSHNCSGHGVCKIGGICDCDLYFQPPTCFVKNCPNDCNAKGDCFRSISQKFGEEVLTPFIARLFELCPLMTLRRFKMWKQSACAATHSTENRARKML